MKNKKYYENHARKILAMSKEDAEVSLRIIAKFYGPEEVSKIVSQFSSVLAEV